MPKPAQPLDTRLCNLFRFTLKLARQARETSNLVTKQVCCIGFNKNHGNVNPRVVVATFKLAACFFIATSLTENGTKHINRRLQDAKENYQLHCIRKYRYQCVFDVIQSFYAMLWTAYIQKTLLVNNIYILNLRFKVSQI